jgi:hypothetical protein
MIESLAFDEEDMSCDSHTFSKPLDFDSSDIQKDICDFDKLMVCLFQLIYYIIWIIFEII